MNRGVTVAVLLTGVLALGSCRGFAGSTTDTATTQSGWNLFRQPAEETVIPEEDQHEREDEPLITIHALTFSVTRAAPYTVIVLPEDDLLTEYLQGEKRATVGTAAPLPRSRLIFGFAVETQGVPPFHPYPEDFSAEDPGQLR